MMEKLLNQEEVVVVVVAPEAEAEAKDVLEQLPPSAPATANMAVLASIGPITLDSKRESGEFLFGFASLSPLSFVSSSPPKDIVEHSTSTPKEEGVSFDPFPTTTTNGSPDKITLLALEHLECPSVGRRRRRQLNFESPAKPANSRGSNSIYIIDDDEEEEEDMLLETVVYETLLEAIVSKQTDESLLLPDEISVSTPPHQTSPSPPKTPTHAPHLDGVAETCPAAPMKKCTTKSRNIDRGLCRKLEF